MITRRSWIATAAIAFSLGPIAAFAEQGDDSPMGVVGGFNGDITTAGQYDPYTGSMRRQIDDIIVPGSVGAYPLKWTRYWNSHTSWKDKNFIGAGWRFSYVNYRHGPGYPANFPDGRQITDAYGIEEWVETFFNGGEIIHLADGGKVMMAGSGTAGYLPAAG